MTDDFAPTMSVELPAALAEVPDLYDEIYVIVSPPRCCSTAFTRVFWEHPSVRFYSHEPFEVTYYRDAPLSEVAAKLRAPLDLTGLTSARSREGASALVIKEMPYQVGDSFPMLAALTRRPIVFLLRDPRRNIASRIRKKLEVGDSPIFPLIESGWELIERQIEHCRTHDIDHLIVTSQDFRGRPLEVFPPLFERLGMEFSPRMLEWKSCPDVEIDNLGGDHSHLYRAVLSSTGLAPESRALPELNDFPSDGGLRDHVVRCLEIYERLRLTTIAG